MNDKVTRGRAILFYGLGGIYLFAVTLVVHGKHVAMENPRMDFFRVIWYAFFDIFKNPLRVFPLAPGTFGAIIYTVSMLTVIVGIIAINASFRKHDDKAAGPDEWMENVTDYDKKFTEPFGQAGHDGVNNVIISQDIRLAIDNEKTGRNLNMLVIGGSGSGKSFRFVIPNLLQKNCSFVITDPSGSLYRQCGKFLEYFGYKVKCFNLSHMDKGNHYNPFRYIRSDTDVEILVKTLITNTTPPDQHGGDPFWEKSETALLVALIAYLYHYTQPSQQTFTNVMHLLRAAEVREDDSTYSSTLDEMFQQIEEIEPDSFAVRQYKTFKMGESKTLSSILISCAVRLQSFDLREVENLTSSDDISLDTIGDEKTALFIILPTGDSTFNFLAAMMYSQLFQRTYDYAENTAEYGQLVIDGEGQIVRCFRANDEDQSKIKAKEAEAFLEQAKTADIVYRHDLGWYEIVTKEGEMVGYRGSKEEAEKAVKLIREGKVISNSDQSNRGQRLPVHVRMLLDEFSNIGKIPDFEKRLATMRKYELSVSIILQSLSQLKNLYKDNWSEISGNCDTTLYIGGGADLDSGEWLSKLLGKETKTIMNVSFGKGGGSTSYNKQGVELLSPAQIRTLPEDECIVIPKSLSAFKGKKYNTLEHPMWKLKSDLGPYYYSEEKRRLLYEQEEDQVEDDVPTVEEDHGDRSEDEDIKDAIQGIQQEQQQKAAEYSKNRDAEGSQIVKPPLPVEKETDNNKANETDSPDPGMESSEDTSSEKEKIQETPSTHTPIPEWLDNPRSSSLDVNDEAWGIEELEYMSVQADYMSS